MGSGQSGEEAGSEEQGAGRERQLREWGEFRELVGLNVVLYSKPVCGLCDEMKSDLRTLAAEFAAEGVALVVEECNIETDAEAYERFRYLIPVLDVGGTLLYPPHTLEGTRRALRSALAMNGRRDAR